MSERIVVCLTSAEQEYQALQAEDARAAGRRLAASVEVLFAEDNAVLQIQQLFRFVHAPEAERPVAIVLHTRVPDGLERVARNAARAGIGWLLLNRSAPYVEALRSEYPVSPWRRSPPITSRSAGSRRVSSSGCARGPPHPLRAGPGRHLRGAAAPGRLRAGGARGGLELKLLNGEWTETSAEKAVAAWLRLKTAELFAPDAVVCQNDNMARGTRRVLELLRSEWAKAPFLGCDGLPTSGRRDVEQGRLAATVLLPSCAGPAIELALRWKRDGAEPPAETVLAPAPYPAL